MLLNDYYELTLAAHYLAALVNDDYTGLDDDEAADLNAFMRDYYRLEDMTISTVGEEPHFTIDAVSGLYADCYTIRFYFTNHSLTPQQCALDLN